MVLKEYVVKHTQRTGEFYTRLQNRLFYERNFEEEKKTDGRCKQTDNDDMILQEEILTEKSEKK